MNKSRVRQAHRRVSRKGATLAQLEGLYRDRFEHFARVASAICGDRDHGRDAVQAAFVTAVRQRRGYRGTGAIECVGLEDRRQ
jgi:DNA-directed RNA polymerase specialized sigma24 family protein